MIERDEYSSICASDECRVWVISNPRMVKLRWIPQRPSGEPTFALNILIALDFLQMITSDSSHSVVALIFVGPMPPAACLSRLDPPDVLYSSHMLEHLDTVEAMKFLIEARRVLKHGGIIRLAVPDLRRMIADYETDGDADRLVSRTQLAHTRPATSKNCAGSSSPTEVITAGCTMQIP